MRRIVKYLKPYIWQILLVLALVFVQAMTDLKLPDYMSKIVNEGVLLGDNGVILSTGLEMLAIALVGCTIAAGFLASCVATGYARDLRNAIFEKVENYSLSEFDKFSTASLITRTTNDVQQVQMVMIIFLRMIVLAPIMAIGGLSKAIAKNPSMTWIIAASVLCLFVLMGILFSVGLPKMKRMQSAARYDAADEFNYGAYHLGWCQCSGRWQHAGRRYDGFYAVCYADHVLFPYRIDDLHHDPACIGIGWPYCRCAGNRAYYFGSRTAVGP